MSGTCAGRYRPGPAVATILAVVATVASATAASADPTEFRLRRAWSLFGANPGFGGLLAADFDLDGRLDLLTSSALSYNSKRHDWYLARLHDSEFEVTWSSLFHQDGTGLLTAGTAYGLPAVAVTTWYEVQIFSGPTKALLDIVPVAISEIAALHLADLDLDGQEEIVVCDRYDLFVYDLRTGVEEDVRLGFGCEGLDSGQLDDDPPLELVVAGNPLGGFVLDGSSLALEWADTGGFGSIARVLDLDSDGLGEIVAGNFAGDSLRAIDTRKGSTLWDAPGIEATSIVPAELDSDSTPELVVIDNHSTILALDAQSGDIRFSIPSPGHAEGAAAGDFDYNGTTEIVVSGGSDGDFFAIDTASHGVFARSRPWTSLVLDVVVGDLDANGGAELLVASAEVTIPYLAERVIVLPASAAAPARYAPPIVYPDLTAVGLAQLDQDPAQEYCVAEYSTALISCFDGQDFSHQWDLPLQGADQIHFIASYSIDPDPEDELIVSLNGTRLVALAGSTGEILWEAAVPPGLSGEFYGLRVENFDADAGLEIAVAPGAFRFFGGGGPLVLFDLESGALVAGPHQLVRSFDAYRAAEGPPASLLVTVEGGLAVMDPLTGTTSAPIVSIDDDVFAVSVSDLTRDGTLDVVAALEWEIRIYDGDDGAEVWRSPPLSLPGHGDTLLSRDFDRDTVPEIVVMTLAGVAWYDAPLLSVFRDGFEAGDYGAWSDVVP